MEKLASLGQDDFERTEPSTVRRGDLVWVFRPTADILSKAGGIETVRLWIRLIERSGIVVVSFHEG